MTSLVVVCGPHDNTNVTHMALGGPSVWHACSKTQESENETGGMWWKVQYWHCNSGRKYDKTVGSRFSHSQSNGWLLHEPNAKDR